MCIDAYLIYSLLLDLAGFKHIGIRKLYIRREYQVSHQWYSQKHIIKAYMSMHT